MIEFKQNGLECYTNGTRTCTIFQHTSPGPYTYLEQGPKTRSVSFSKLVDARDEVCHRLGCTKQDLIEANEGFAKNLEVPKESLARPLKEKLDIEPIKAKKKKPKGKKSKK